MLKKVQCGEAYSSTAGASVFRKPLHNVPKADAHRLCFCMRPCRLGSKQGDGRGQGTGGADAHKGAVCWGGNEA